MKRACLVCTVFLLTLTVQGTADENDWRLTPPPSAISEVDRNLIGRTVCGEDGFEVEEGVLRCNLCPEFTGNPGSREGLEIGSVMQGRFSGRQPGVGTEWLLDTDGCESHNESFGGVILMGPIPVKSTGGASKDSPPAATKLFFYQSGYRVNDCLLFAAVQGRNLLVCNEADMAQGEVIGHISLMEITRRGINRWRLLRWYDNSGSDMQEVVSVVPSDMRAQDTKSGTQLLQIGLSLLETTRERYDQTPEPKVKAISLEFQRTGQRFYPTRQTQVLLAEIGALTRKMLDEER